MAYINKGIHLSGLITKWIAIVALFLMMIVITLSVLLRTFGSPFSGQVEIVELLMLTVIMVGLSYTQSENGHVEVGLIIDRLPLRVQAVFDIIASILMMSVSFIIAFYNFQGFFNYIEIGYTSQILSIPLFPFKFIVAIGLLLWGMEAFLKLIKAAIVLRTGENPEK